MVNGNGPDPSARMRSDLAYGLTAETVPASLRPTPLRHVHRAIADLRRGTPVVLTGAGLLEAAPRLVVLAAETAGARGLTEFAAVATSEPLLLLAPSRAAAVLRRPVQDAAVALALPRELLAPALLRTLADPTVEQLLPSDPLVSAPPPPDAPAVLALVKLTRLLPAAIVAPLRAGADAALADLSLLRVAAGEVLAYPDEMARRLVRVAEARVPLADAPDARLVAFRGPDAGIEHLAILVGEPETAPEPLVRLHSECFTGDLLGSLRCDCGPQLHTALRRMAEDGHGVLLYLAQEGRGIGLVNKLRAYALQDRGLDTLDANRALGWDADERDFRVAATMLEALGVGRLRLLTNNPGKVTALRACGLDVRREPHGIAPNGVNDAYLATKAARFGHLFG